MTLPTAICQYGADWFFEYPDLCIPERERDRRASAIPHLGRKEVRVCGVLKVFNGAVRPTESIDLQCNAR